MSGLSRSIFEKVARAIPVEPARGIVVLPLWVAVAGAPFIVGLLLLYMLGRCVIVFGRALSAGIGHLVARIRRWRSAAPGFELASGIVVLLLWVAVAGAPFIVGLLLVYMRGRCVIVFGRALSAGIGHLVARIRRWRSAAPGFELASGIVVLPLWVAVAGAPFIVGLLLLYKLGRSVIVCGRALSAGIGHLAARILQWRSAAHRAQFKRASIASVGVVLVIVGIWAGLFVADRQASYDLAAERRALDARAFELSSLALMRGSALSCLNVNAGNTDEASCERALFATPEATASAISYVAAQVALLADGTAFAQREPSYLPTLSYLRRTLESDRFGLVAHALSARRDCTPDRCVEFALLNESARVRANLFERSYEHYVMRHASGWSPIAKWPERVSLPGAAVVEVLTGSVGTEGSKTGVAVPLWQSQPRSASPATDEERLVARAKYFLDQGDIVGARRFLERAFEKGSARAAFLLAETYDGRSLQSLHTIGVRADVDKARKFYEAAAVGGIEQAKERLQVLKSAEWSR